MSQKGEMKLRWEKIKEGEENKDGKLFPLCNLARAQSVFRRGPNPETLGQHLEVETRRPKVWEF